METIEVFKLHEEAIIPRRNLGTDAGLDLFALSDTFVPINGLAKVVTGISVRIPERHVGMIKDRSSTSSKGLKVAGGIIDTGYSGSMDVLIHNNLHTLDSHIGQRGYWIKKGEKIAQLLVLPIALPEPVEVKELWSSERGARGYGSSGR